MSDIHFSAKNISPNGGLSPGICTYALIVFCIDLMKKIKAVIVLQFYH